MQQLEEVRFRTDKKTSEKESSSCFSVSGSRVCRGRRRDRLHFSSFAYSFGNHSFLLRKINIPVDFIRLHQFFMSSHGADFTVIQYDNSIRMGD